MSVGRSNKNQSMRDDLRHEEPEKLRRVQGRQRRHGRLRQANDEWAARISLRDKADIAPRTRTCRRRDREREDQKIEGKRENVEIDSQ
jgi:hypothetical protein